MKKATIRHAADFGSRASDRLDADAGGRADNYPNPFNPATIIEYSLAEDAAVPLAIYSVLGQRIGSYQGGWDATDDRSQRVSSGLYFYRLQAGDGFRATRKMLLIK